ncbi:unnamed protein product [Moneuplotes crassus]|uniref:Uncharacterized protein n=1 Tax=Euplotes crassus TaxID=5936 RepID=A0AAD1UCL2_EUPCR|nr:unnamed protein product [Moneuplotes crassus]
MDSSSQAFTRIGPLSVVVGYTGLNARSQIFLTEARKGMKKCFSEFRNELFRAVTKPKYTMHFNNLDYPTMLAYIKDLYVSYYITFSLSDPTLLRCAVKFLCEKRLFVMISVKNICIRHDLYDEFCGLLKAQDTEEIKFSQIHKRAIRKCNFTEEGNRQTDYWDMNIDNMKEWDKLKESEPVEICNARIILDPTMAQHIRQFKCSAELVTFFVRSGSAIDDLMSTKRSQFFRNIESVEFDVIEQSSISMLFKIDKLLKKFPIATVKELKNIYSSKILKDLIHKVQYCNSLSMDWSSDIKARNVFIYYQSGGNVYRADVNRISFQVNLGEDDSLPDCKKYINCISGPLNLIDMSDWKVSRIKNPNKELCDMLKSDDSTILLRNRKLKLLFECSDMFYQPVKRMYELLDVELIDGVKNYGDISLFSHFKPKPSMCPQESVLSFNKQGMPFEETDLKILELKGVDTFIFVFHSSEFLVNLQKCKEACEILFGKASKFLKIFFIIYYKNTINPLQLTRKSRRDEIFKNLSECKTEKDILTSFKKYHSKWSQDDMPYIKPSITRYIK